MKVALITFPGSNCEDDAFHALTSGCRFEVTRLWHKDSKDLGDFDLVFLPGGFSYGDYLRAGALAARSPIMKDVIHFADRGGFVLGVCNGFQILCESGLLPGALAKNESLNFVCQDAELKVENLDTPWTLACPSTRPLSLPIAHGDGRYILSEFEYSGLKKKGQILFTYQNNPNGSLYDIAGICNEQKNVMGMMPHPERATDLRSGDGMFLWKSLQDWIGAKRT